METGITLPTSPRNKGCFNWATEIYPWKPVVVVWVTAINKRFNWATEIYPWKREEDADGEISIGVLQLGHGDLPVETCIAG